MTSNILSVKAIKGNNRSKRAWVGFDPTPRSNRVKRKWKPLPIKSIDKTSNNQIPYNWNDFNDFINNMKEYRKERSDWNSCFWTSRISRQGDKSSLSQIQFILCPTVSFEIERLLIHQNLRLEKANRTIPVWKISGH